MIQGKRPYLAMYKKMEEIFGSQFSHSVLTNFKKQGYENGYFVGPTIFDDVKPDMLAERRDSHTSTYVRTVTVLPPLPNTKSKQTAEFQHND